MANENQQRFANMDLDELKRREEYMRDTNDRQETRVQDMQSKAYQLANFYLVFQGVILTAIFQSPPDKCSYWWVPFSLSLLATLINGIAFYIMMSKYVNTKLNHLANLLETQDLNIVMRRKIEENQRQYSEAGSVATQSEVGEDDGPNRQTQGVLGNNARIVHNPPERDGVTKQKYQIYFWGTMGALFAFAILMLIASRKVPCTGKK